MWRFNPLTVSGVGKLSSAISQMEHARMPITKLAPMDLHLKKTSTLQKTREAAVLVSLCNVNEVPSLLYTVRSSKLRSHTGQVSFPGGGIDPGETPVEAALRETYEEIGIKKDDIHVVGLGQTIFSITGMLVTPVVALIKPDLGSVQWEQQQNDDEVDTVFTRPLALFTDADSGFSARESLSRDNVNFVEMPVYGRDADGTRGKETIWGMTAMITEAIITHMVD